MSRVDAARRLEVSSPIERDGLVAGTFGGFPVELTGAPPFNGLTIDVERPLPIECLSAQGAPTNDPDVVLTGDEAFDEAVLSLATDGRAPWLAQLLASGELRGLLRDVLKRHPLCEVRAGRITLPAPEGGVTVNTLRDTAALARALRSAFDVSTRLEPEPAPRLPDGPPWWKDPTRRRRYALRGLGGVAVTGAVGGVMTAGAAYGGTVGFVIAGAAMVVFGIVAKEASS